MGHPVISGVSLCLAHVPGLVRYGSKPTRALPRGGLEQFQLALRSFEEAVRYPPHQVFIGNKRPEDLAFIERPWYQQPAQSGATAVGPYGLIVSEDAFLGLLRFSDGFGLVQLRGDYSDRVGAALSAEVLNRLGEWPGITIAELERGAPARIIERHIEKGAGLSLSNREGQQVGCVLRAHELDETLQPQVLLENLACKASAALALRHLFGQPGAPGPEEVDFVLSCGEEAVGDRYQRGGGNIAKAIAEAAGCLNASGADVKAFCSAPIQALVVAASLVQAGTFRTVVVAAGGSLAKLGMKYEGHLRHGMPILEDVLGAFAIAVAPGDGRNPAIDLNSVGKHPVGSGSSQEAILSALVEEPLGRLGMRMVDVDKYALELHNPEITEPAGSGNIPRVNYRTLASMAALRGEMSPTDLDAFLERHGLPGFSPTQGHIAAAVPFLPHARQRILDGEIENTMFVAKGSLFLGRMTNLSDGMSFLLSANGRKR